MTAPDAGGADPPNATDMNATLRHNIELLRGRRLRESRAASFGDRIAERMTSFTGSMAFVYFHLVLYGAWIACNLGWLPGVPRFDPTFVILAMEASVEAIFLSTFVLISQNRMSVAADRRAELDLHISLLTEHELTKMADLIACIAERLGLRQSDPEFHEIRKNVHPDRVLDALDEDRASSDG